MGNRLSRKLVLGFCFVGTLVLTLLITPRLLSFPTVISLSVASSPTSAISTASDTPPLSSSVPEPQSTQVAVSSSYQAIDEYHNPSFTVDSKYVFNNGRLPGIQVNFDANDLLTVLKNTQTYFQTYATENPDVMRSGILGTQGVSVADVLDTLTFMISTLEEDIANQQPIRLRDPNFLNTHFRVLAWSAYDPANLREEELRITKYAVFTHPGSHTRTATYNVPLYQLTEAAETDRFYLNYTKQQVLSGIYEAGGQEFGRAEPIAYLTREGFEDALMQGTILINFIEGDSAFFNVDRNNGIAYNPDIAPYQQGRYWYFKPVDAIKGYGHTSEAKISIEPGVTFAGDVLNIGLGRIVVLEHSTGGQAQLQMGIIADTGGAFLPNLHQLDFLAGVFGDRDEFYAAVSHLPEYSKAYILIHRDPATQDPATHNPATQDPAT